MREEAAQPTKTAANEDIRWLIRSLENRLAHSGEDATEKTAHFHGGLQLSQGAVESRLFVVERERNIMKQMLLAIESEEKALNCVKRRHANASSPINRLPDEILSLIFTSNPFPPYVDTRWRPSHPPSIFSYGQYRKSVTATCHRWRDVTLRTPSFWSVVRYVSHDGDPTPLDAVRTRLSRSGSVKLDISIEISDHCFQYEYDGVIKTAFMVLEPALFRCFSLSLCLDVPYQDTEIHLFSIPVPMPALERLYVYWNIESMEHQNVDFSMGPLAAPRRLFIESESACSVDTHDLDCSRLEGLTVLGPIDSGDVIDLLRRRPSLIDLEWNREDTWTLEGVEDVQLPYLKSLNAQLPPTTLRRLKAESLHTLQLFQLEEDESTEIFDPITQYPGIRTLCLPEKIGSETRLTYLRGFQHLEELSVSLSNSTSYSDLTTLAHLSSQNDMVLQGLRLLELEVPYFLNGPESLDKSLAKLLTVLARSRGARVERTESLPILPSVSPDEAGVGGISGLVPAIPTPLLIRLLCPSEQIRLMPETLKAINKYRADP